MQGLSEEEFLKGITFPRNQELIKIFKDVDLIESIGSGVLRILEQYDKSCFQFMEHFLRVSFKYRENTFEYDDTVEEKSNIKSNIKIKPTEENILNFCIKEKSLIEIIEHFNFRDKRKFKANYINYLLEQKKLVMTIPEQPKNRNQKYVAIKQVK